MNADWPSIHNPHVLKALLRAGLIAPDADLFSAFLVLGSVINDRVLFEKSLVGPFTWVEIDGEMVRCAAQVTTRSIAEVLSGLTKAELAALRERVL
jgi:hypothetical protein